MIAGVGVITFAASGQLGFFASLVGTHPHESTAEFVGDDAIFYASMNLRPGPTALNDARKLLDRVRENAEIDREYDEALVELEDQMGMDITGKLFRTIGPEVAVAAYLEAESYFLPDVVLFAGYQDYEVAKDLLDGFLNDQTADGSTAMTSTVDGLEVFGVAGPYSFDGADTFYALVPEPQYFIYTTSEDLLYRTLELMSTRTGTLAQTSDFIELRSRLPGNRIVSAFASSDAFSKFAQNSVIGMPSDYYESDPLGESLGSSGSAEEGRDSLGAFAFAITVADNNLKFDYIMKGDTQGIEGVSNLDDVPGMLPTTTVAFMSIGGLHSFWDAVQGNLSAQPETQGLFDSVFSEFEDASGIDVNDDILAALGERIGVAFLGGVVDPAMEDLSGLDAVALIEIADRERADATVAKIRNLIEDSGAAFEPVQLEQTEAWFTDSDSGGTRVGYMFVGDFLAIGLSQDSLEDVEAVYLRKDQALTSDSSYKAAFDGQSGADVVAFYLSVPALVDVIEAAIPADARTEYELDVKPWLDMFDTVAGGGSVNGEWTTGWLSVSLR